jgi:hypothetical protein
MQQDTTIQQRQQQHEYMMYIVYTSLAHKAVATENLKPIEMEETKKKTTPGDKDWCLTPSLNPRRRRGRRQS